MISENKNGHLSCPGIKLNKHTQPIERKFLIIILQVKSIVQNLTLNPHHSLYLSLLMFRITWSMREGIFSSIAFQNEISNLQVWGKKGKNNALDLFVFGILVTEFFGQLQLDTLISYNEVSPC